MGRGGDFFFAFYICKHFIHDFFFLFTNVNFTFINVQAGTRRPPRRARLAAGQTRSAAERMAAANAPRQRAAPTRPVGSRSDAERSGADGGCQRAPAACHPIPRRHCANGRSDAERSGADGGRARLPPWEGWPLPGRKRGGAAAAGAQARRGWPARACLSTLIHSFPPNKCF